MKIKRTVLLSIVCLYLLMLFGGFTPRMSATENKVVTERAVIDKTGRQTRKTIVGEINGEPFFQEDLAVYVSELRAVVAAYYGRKYNLSGIGADFWDTRFDGVTPREFLSKLAFDGLKRDMVLMQEARIRAIDAPSSYSALEKEREAWNVPTDEIVFGPKTFSPTEYNSYRMTGIRDNLKTALLRGELAPTVVQLKAAFDKLPQEIKTAPYRASGIRFSWDAAFAQDEEIRIDIERSLQQGFSPNEIIDRFSAVCPNLSLNEFDVNSRYVSKEAEYDKALANILQKTGAGLCTPGPEERPELYYVTHKQGGGYYTFEEAPGLGRNKWINDQFDVFLEDKLENASVTLFSDNLTASVSGNEEKPIDLSKYSTIIEAAGTGTLKSRGKAAAGATTYYIDYTNGNDANSGVTPLQAWKTFKHINLKTLNPGDHILLEANSIWNGTPVDKDNYIAQAQERGNGGMLAPQGSGTAEKRCVIDLYEIKELSGGSITVYWSADKRPVINGNGTPFLNSDDPYKQSGAIHLEGQDYWEIRNIEVTNSFDFPEIGTNPSLLHTHWYKREVPKSLVGILVTSTPSHSHCKGILIENCYAHDVQSLHSNNKPVNEHDWYDSDHFGFVCSNPGKSGGGILFAVTESVIQGNIVRRTALEGMRTIHGRSGEKIIIRGNYIETVAGDGIVISQVTNDNLVESNLVKDACAAPNFGSGNYAASWCYVATNTLYQYNESWGTLYGYLDGEAWDVDLNSDKVIYQYNYSHHNAGGAILFMGNQTNSIFRYNISANDGGGSKYMATLVSPDALPVDQAARSYTNWNSGQSLIHYTISDTAATPRIPLVHNNTFYIGDGVNASIYGNTTSGRKDKYVRFYNNIVLKAGSGEVRLSDTHRPETSIVVGNILNPAGFKNNLMYGYDTDRKQGDISKFLTGNITMDQWVNDFGNKWADPMLKIQETGVADDLRKQRDDSFPEADYASSDKLGDYTSVGRLRMRASLFTPLAGSPAIEGGIKIPAGISVPEADGAWNGNIGALSTYPVHWDDLVGTTTDMFGNAINPDKPPVGGAAKTYP